MTQVEAELKAQLNNLTKIPAKEFEKQFQEWMERDDVARALQAKLRYDLISNFNNTALGKQILAQTTTTFSSRSSHRLKLSPLVLALNTLVAELLYVENCHFSLSVFCTEVPFRNTLPDFESQHNFRFNDDEIVDILEALSVAFKPTTQLRADIIQNYSKNKQTSLLLLILQTLLHQLESPAHAGKRDASTTVDAEFFGSSKAATVTTQTQRAHQSNDAETLERKNSFQQLNKYLIVLSKKMKEMTSQFAHLQMTHNAPPRGSTLNVNQRARLAQTAGTRRFDKLNRSLERITLNLRKMSHAKRRSKQISVIVSAIEALSTQFDKCAINFDNVSKRLMESKSQKNYESKPTQSEEQFVNVNEKSYTDWIHEMRNTKNGQKFLERIEASLRKALTKQKEMLRSESDMKMKHQKELLKIRYKQKLIQHLSKNSFNEQGEVRKLSEDIQKQLREFETRHSELLLKVGQKERQDGGGTKVDDIPKKQQVSTDALRSSTVILPSVPETVSSVSVMPSREISYIPGALPTRVIVQKLPITNKNIRQLEHMADNITTQERNIDSIVYEAKLRLKELENESNQLEENFRHYLERQRLQANVMQEVVASIHSNDGEKSSVVKENANKIIQQQKTHGDSNSNSNEVSSLTEDSLPESLIKYKTKLHSNSVEPRENKPTTSGTNSYQMEFPNPILEAKKKFFKLKESIHPTNTSIYAAPSSSMRQSIEQQVLPSPPSHHPTQTHQREKLQLELLEQTSNSSQNAEASEKPTRTIDERIKDLQSPSSREIVVSGTAVFDVHDFIKHVSQAKSPPPEQLNLDSNTHKSGSDQQKPKGQQQYIESPTFVTTNSPTSPTKLTPLVKVSASTTSLTSILLQQSMARMYQLFAAAPQAEVSADRHAEEGELHKPDTMKTPEHRPQSKMQQKQNIINNNESFVLSNAGGHATAVNVDDSEIATTSQQVYKNKNGNSASQRPTGAQRQKQNESGAQHIKSAATAFGEKQSVDNNQLLDTLQSGQCDDLTKNTKPDVTTCTSAGTVIIETPTTSTVIQRPHISVNTSTDNTSNRSGENLADRIAAFSLSLEELGKTSQNIVEMNQAVERVAIPLLEIAEEAETSSNDIEAIERPATAEAESPQGSGLLHDISSLSISEILELSTGARRDDNSGSDFWD